MNARIELYAVGDPAPQGSKSHVGNGVMIESSKRVKPWRRQVAAAARDGNVQAFQKGKARVFLAQIAAAGEAIDLSAACELLVVEPSFQPAQMKQIALRVTNHSQARQVRVRVAALEGSIDDAIQSSLLRKWSVINEVLTK